LTQTCHVGEIAISNDSPLSPQPLALYLVSKMLAILSYSYNAQCRSLALRPLLDNITSRFAPVFTQQLSWVLRYNATRCRTVALHVAQHRRRCVSSPSVHTSAGWFGVLQVK